MTARQNDFEGCLAGNLRAASRLVTRLYDSHLREVGLRITQVAILAQIRRSEPTTATDLAKDLSSERSAVTRDVRVLQRGGLVTVDDDEDDRRARAIRLTDLGRQSLEAAVAPWSEAQKLVIDRFTSSDTADLLAGLRALVDELGTP